MGNMIIGGRPVRWVYMDDERAAPEHPDEGRGNTWILCKTVESTLAVIDEILAKDPSTLLVLSLDHDMGENVPTGYAAITALAEKWDAGLQGFPALINIHSMNHPAKMNMYQFLRDYADSVGFTLMLAYDVPHVTMNMVSILEDRFS